MTATSFTTYNVRVYSEGFQIGEMGFIGLLVDSSLINNPKLNNVIMITDCAYSGTATQQTSYVVQYPGVNFWFEHTFFGLYHFVVVDKPNFEFFVQPTGKVQLIKEANMLKVGSYILVFYSQMCIAPTFLDVQTGNCILCPDRCTSCNSTQCFSCTNGFTPSTDKKSCICPSTVVTDICQDFTTGPMKGCVLAIQKQTQVLCMACSMPQYMQAKNYECTCKQGFKFDSNGNCFELCGDGLTENAQCDDGNLVDGDGCSSSCHLEPGFKCTVKKTSSQCKSQIYLIFQTISIMKNEDNSADITFGLYQKSIPFDLKKQNFETPTGIPKKYSIKLQMEDGSISELSCILESVQNNQLKFNVDYNFTIEGMNAKVYLDMSDTKYTIKEINYSFSTVGDNEPLRFSGKLDLFMGAERGYLGMSIIYVLLLLVGLIAPKYIGLEAMLTLQLIYYSCLLVIDSQRYPVGFGSFSLLKLSTGYNEFIEVTTLLLNSDLVSKLNLIGFKKLIIQNYNASFILLFLSGLVFGISYIIRRSQEQSLIEQTQVKEGISKKDCKQIRDKFEWSLKINQILFRVYDQISVWSILQIMCAISAQLTISHKSFVINEKSVFMSLGSIVSMISVILIIVAGLNHFKNILLSPITIRKLQERPSEVSYKRVNFIYIVLVGTIIFFFHQKYIWKIYSSVFVTLVHLGYILVLWKIKPYQKSLHVHSLGLFTNQIIYLLFLIFVNMINYLDEINQIISLAFVYFILFLCIIVILFTVIRLYYEYRYGQKLQIQIQKQREEEERKHKLKEERILKRKMKTFQQEAKQRLDEKLKKHIKNKYFFENQIIEAQMNELIEFWGKRPNLKQQHKESQYFKKYCQKPKNWLKSNQPEDYKKRLMEQEKTRMLEREKHNSKYDDPQYQRVSARLRKQFVRKTEKQKSLKRKKKSSQQ